VNRFGQTFEKWMKAVDAWSWEKHGLSIHDLPDAPFADWFADGMTARAAASKAYKLAEAA